MGMFVELRYDNQRVDQPIQKWKMPAIEKGFFTCYAMNLCLESDGFDCLANQKTEDVRAFIRILKQLGASKTSEIVGETIQALRKKKPCDTGERTSAYYRTAERETLWLKLLDYVGERIHTAYVNRAEEIHTAGRSIFSSKEWQK